jgi:ectoine hydroxylase
MPAGVMPTGPITDDQVSAYHQEGYVLAKGMFEPDEIQLLGRAAREDGALDRHSFGRADGEGGTVRLSLWNHPGDTIYGMAARCRRVVGSAEKLLAGEVYHYHSKMIMKDARTGGAWAWHQDYGYWYQNGVLFPLLCSASIAVDAATKENGCLQVIRGSHHLGRIGPRPHRRPGRRRSGARRRSAETAGSGLCRNAAGRHAFLPLQSVASLRPEPLRACALVDDLLL